MKIFISRALEQFEWNAFVHKLITTTQIPRLHCTQSHNITEDEKCARTGKLQQMPEYDVWNIICNGSGQVIDPRLMNSHKHIFHMKIDEWNSECGSHLQRINLKDCLFVCLFCPFKSYEKPESNKWISDVYVLIMHRLNSRNFVHKGSIGDISDGRWKMIAIGGKMKKDLKLPIAKHRWPVVQN